MLLFHEGACTRSRSRSIAYAQEAPIQCGQRVAIAVVGARFNVSYSALFLYYRRLMRCDIYCGRVPREPS